MAATADSTSSTEGSGRVVVGRVTGAHGLQGNISVRYFGADPDNLMVAPSVMLAEREDDAEVTTFEVEQSSAGRSGEVRMRLTGVGDRDRAEQLKGHWVLVDATQLAELEEGEYYSYQLVGCEVELEDGRSIGKVKEIWSTGAPDIFVVEDERGRQQLIPAAEGLLREVDIEARRIVVEVPPGLLEDEE